MLVCVRACVVDCIPVDVLHKDHNMPIATLDYTCGFAKLAGGAESCEFVQAEPAKGLASSVHAIFPGNVVARVQACYWEVILTLREPASVAEPGSVAPTTRLVKAVGSKAPKTRETSGRSNSRSLMQAAEVEQERHSVCKLGFADASSQRVWCKLRMRHGPVCACSCMYMVQVVHAAWYCMFMARSSCTLRGLCAGAGGFDSRNKFLVTGGFDSRNKFLVTGGFDSRKQFLVTGGFLA